MFNDPILLAIGALAVIVATALTSLAALGLPPSLLKPRAGRSGDWVAEVWLDWEICRGSTMYRQRFAHRWSAYLAVRFHAIVLDFLLPTHYVDTDCSGRPRAYRHNYAILYGVRKVLASEAQDFHPVWSQELPGHNGYSGEHAMCHPLSLDELSGSTLGYKL